MKKLSTLFIALLLSGCATLNYGNFTQLSPNQDAYLVKDAITQLNMIFPPARHTFCIGQKINDSFGKNIVSAMRKKGYGVIDSCSKQKANFFYVVDVLGDTEPSLYRVSLFVGSQTLSRVYINTNGTINNLSEWTHKE